MDSTTSAGVLTTIENLAGAFPAISLFITSLFGFFGVVLIGNAVRGFYDLQAHGSYAHGNYQHRTNGGLVWRMFIGSVLTGGAWGLGILGNTIFGTEIASGAMAYQTAGMSATQQAAVQAVFALFAITGYIAFGHGWMQFDAHTSGRSNSGWKPAAVFIISGTLLVYLQQVLNIVADITGINFINMLLF